MRLKRWVKVVLTLLVALISTLIYAKTGFLGELAQNSRLYLHICIIAWIWLFMGQFAVYYFIWE